VETSLAVRLTANRGMKKLALEYMANEKMLADGKAGVMDR